MTYKLTKNIDGIISTTQVQRISDGAVIPFDPANKDYQKYLEWTKASPMNVAAPPEEEAEEVK